MKSTFVPSLLLPRYTCAPVHMYRRRLPIHHWPHPALPAGISTSLPAAPHPLVHSAMSRRADAHLNAAVPPSPPSPSTYDVCRPPLAPPSPAVPAPPAVRLLHTRSTTVRIHPPPTGSSPPPHPSSLMSGTHAVDVVPATAPSIPRAIPVICDFRPDRSHLRRLLLPALPRWRVKPTPPIIPHWGLTSVRWWLMSARWWLTSFPFFNFYDL
jgi:hypothetical protein